MDDLRILNQNEYFSKIREYDHIVLFGAGSKAHQAMKTLERMNVCISYVCDNDNAKRGEEFGTHKICSFDDVVLDCDGDEEKICVIITAAINNAIDIARGIKNKADCRIVQLCIPFKTESRLLWQQEFDENRVVIKDISDCLGDDRSKSIYSECVGYKLTGNFFPLLSFYEEESTQYTFFDHEIMGDCNEKTLIDVGAYTGDTAISFAMFTAGKYTSIEAFEADDAIYEALCSLVEYSRIRDFYTHKQALWSENEEREWYTFGEGNSVHYDSPNLFRSVDETIDRKTLKKSMGGQTSEVKKISVMKLDDFPFLSKLKKGRLVLKVNAMSADYNILGGGVNIIQQYHPLIVLEYGVKPDDLFNIIPFLRSTNPDYKFYFRVKKVFGDIKVVMYAV